MDIVSNFFYSDRYAVLRNGAAVLGLIWLARFSFQHLILLKGAIAAYWLNPLFRKNLKKFGEWAVVTGASDGIGKAYCMELAKKGLKIVLMSRTKSKLDAVADEIRSKYNVETRVIVADFTGGKELYTELGPQLESLDIGVLINNVGMSGEFPDYFAEMTPDTIWNIMTCNTAAMTMMSRLILPKMLTKKKGVIVNVSSGFGRFPASMNTVYSATKVYSDFFSRALQHEYSDKGIIVQSLMPNVVTTNMSKVKRTNTFIPNPATYARSAVGTIGILKRTSGYLPHSAMAWLMDYVLPEWLLMYSSWDTCRKLRAKALKKKQKGQ